MAQVDLHSLMREMGSQFDRRVCSFDVVAQMNVDAIATVSVIL
jgi:hypothetical protein